MRAQDVRDPPGCAGIGQRRTLPAKSGSHLIADTCHRFSPLPFVLPCVEVTCCTPVAQVLNLHLFQLRYRRIVQQDATVLPTAREARQRCSLLYKGSDRLVGTPPTLLSSPFAHSPSAASPIFAPRCPPSPFTATPPNPPTSCPTTP